MLKHGFPHNQILSTDSNSTDATSMLLAELKGILQTFLEITNDGVLNHLHSLELMSFLALDNHL